MTASRSRHSCTYADYLTLPEDMSRRHELLHGELFMVPGPTTQHQRISRNLEIMLQLHAIQYGLGEVFDAPIDVILGLGDAREVAQPDVIFVAQARSEIIKLHGIEGAPDLVAEILSPGTEERDRGYKRTLYQRYGVREYWIIDPQTRTVEVVAAGTGTPRNLTVDDTITSPLFPGLTIALAEVFGG